MNRVEEVLIGRDEQILQQVPRLGDLAPVDGAPGDDFGQRIQMSAGQLHDLVADVKRGVLDAVVAG